MRWFAELPYYAAMMPLMILWPVAGSLPSVGLRLLVGAAFWLALTVIWVRLRERYEVGND